MKDNIKIIKLLFLISLIVTLYIYKNNISFIINESINLWIFNLLPSIFPTVVIIVTLIDSNIDILIPNKLNNIFNKIFKYEKNSLITMILAFIVGMPTNAIIIKEMYKRNKIGENVLLKLLITTSVINPLFLLSMINIKHKLILILIPYLILITESYFIKIDNKLFINNNHGSNNSIITTITDTFNTMIKILGIIICANILIYLLNTILPNNSLKYFILSNLEITTGIPFLLNGNLIKPVKLFILGFLINFGGISILMQIKSITSDIKIDYNTFFKYKLINAFISAVITVFIFS